MALTADGTGSAEGQARERWFVKMQFLMHKKPEELFATAMFIKIIINIYVFYGTLSTVKNKRKSVVAARKSRAKGFVLPPHTSPPPTEHI